MLHRCSRRVLPLVASRATAVRCITHSSVGSSVADQATSSSPWTSNRLHEKHHVAPFGSKAFQADPHEAIMHPNFKEYQTTYRYSIEQPEKFWKEQAHKFIHWFSDFDHVMQGSLEEGDMTWFTNGKLNASHTCIDQHLEKRGDQPAIIWEGDEPGETRTITFRELHRDVCQIANAMKAQGVRKGDTVAIYMPMVPELAEVMLACTRIGAVHSVVFAGFSPEALRDRILTGNAKWVFTTDQGRRGGKTLHLKEVVDAACRQVPELVEKVFVFRRTGADVPMVQGRDVWMDDEVALQRPYCPPEWMDSEDLMFMLFTSGSTGKPKGVAHATAGYLLYAAMTCKYSFDLREGDVHACVADCGWITGHSYIVYGPLANGVTTVMFESLPSYPDHGRYWDLVERHSVTSFYTAPTAIRALMRYDDSDKVKEYDRSSLRVLGSVGEPLNPEAWHWYNDVVGERRCSLVDTYWQTETGGHLMTPLPDKTPYKPGSCCFPVYGIDPVILDPQTGKEIKGNDVEGVLCVRNAWPGFMRTCYGDHPRFLSAYMDVYKGYYFTGDGARRDEDGFYWITGRVDDVLNVSGHRIGTAEVEAAVCSHECVAEAAAVGFPHEVKGEGICCYVILHDHAEESERLLLELRGKVREMIGPFASPDVLVVVPGLPKTRSGKIMRRILRKVASFQEDELGDTSTLADPSVVDGIIEKMSTRKPSAATK